MTQELLKVIRVVGNAPFKLGYTYIYTWGTDEIKGHDNNFHAIYFDNKVYGEGWEVEFKSL